MALHTHAARVYNASEREFSARSISRRERILLFFWHSSLLFLQKALFLPPARSSASPPKRWLPGMKISAATRKNNGQWGGTIAPLCYRAVWGEFATGAYNVIKLITLGARYTWFFNFLPRAAAAVAARRVCYSAEMKIPKEKPAAAAEWIADEGAFMCMHRELVFQKKNGKSH